MIDAATLKTERAGAGIAGKILCKKCGIARSRLSDIERGYVTSSPEEFGRIAKALDELIEAKSLIDHVAVSVGWPIRVRHD